MSLEILFLGSGGCIRVPTFNCTCKVCEEARQVGTTRTRASVAVIGKETTIIDASPDLLEQLERETIRKIENVFITHWHYDHVWGLSGLVEPAWISHWPPVNVYLPEKSIPFFESAMGYMSDSVSLHPVNPGDVIETVDAAFEVVKTNHTADSVGYIVESEKSMAYLIDSDLPPAETVNRVSKCDIVVLDATFDDIILSEEEAGWLHFTLDEAVNFWKQVNVPECIVSHMSCHSVIEGEVVAGLTIRERTEYEEKYEGLTLAYDGLRFQL